MPKIFQKIKIIYQDPNFAILFKPAGLKIHPSNLQEKKLTLVNWLLKEWPKIKNVGDYPEIRPGIAHRLDKDTTGLLIVAKNQKTFLKLKEKFKKRKIQKIYLAWVWGELKQKQSILKNYLIRNKKYALKMAIAKTKIIKSKLAILEYKTLKIIDNQSQVRIKLKTGRTHQIRIQFKNLGHPVVNDRLYGFRKQKIIGNGQLKLIAQGLGFSLSGKSYLFEI